MMLLGSLQQRLEQNPQAHGSPSTLSLGGDVIVLIHFKHESQSTFLLSKLLNLDNLGDTNIINVLGSSRPPLSYIVFDLLSSFLGIWLVLSYLSERQP